MKRKRKTLVQLILLKEHRDEKSFCFHASTVWTRYHLPQWLRRRPTHYAPWNIEKPFLNWRYQRVVGVFRSVTVVFSFAIWRCRMRFFFFFEFLFAYFLIILCRVRWLRVDFYTRSFIFVFAFAVAHDCYWRTRRIHTINGPL